MKRDFTFPNVACYPLPMTNMNQTEFPRNMPGIAREVANARGYLTKCISIDRQELLEGAKEQGVGLVHIYNPENPKGGLTVAFRKVSPYRNGRMVECAVHTCSKYDNFNKKVGTLGALTKFEDAETIQLPLLNMYPERDLAYAVKVAFTALYSATSIL